MKSSQIWPEAILDLECSNIKNKEKKDFRFRLTFDLEKNSESCQDKLTDVTRLEDVNTPGATTCATVM